MSPPRSPYDHPGCDKHSLHMDHRKPFLPPHGIRGRAIMCWNTPEIGRKRLVATDATERGARGQDPRHQCGVTNRDRWAVDQSQGHERALRETRARGRAVGTGYRPVWAIYRHQGGKPE